MEARVARAIQRGGEVGQDLDPAAVDDVENVAPAYPRGGSGSAGIHVGHDYAGVLRQSQTGRQLGRDALRRDSDLQAVNVAAPSQTLIDEPCYLPSSCAEIRDRKSTRLNSSHSSISYAVFCLKK